MGQSRRRTDRLTNINLVAVPPVPATNRPVKSATTSKPAVTDSYAKCSRLGSNLRMNAGFIIIQWTQDNPRAPGDGRYCKTAECRAHTGDHLSLATCLINMQQYYLHSAVHKQLSVPNEFLSFLEYRQRRRLTFTVGYSKIKQRIQGSKN